MHEIYFVSGRAVLDFGGKSFRQVEGESPFRERSVTKKWWDLPSSRLVGPYSCHSTHVAGR